VRSLNPDEAALWAKVTATIRPLSRELPESQPDGRTDGPSAASVPVRNPAPLPRKAPALPPRPIASATLDGSWDRRLRDGAVEPDRTLDLHGMNLDTAWRAIDLGLERAIVNGERVVLLITGHHRPGEPPVKRGKIRGAVNDWLSASRHAGQIAAVRGAHRRHGGGGSLYLILRRPGARR
jgi:DNA-nicking Smr family endonuclease